MTEKRTPVIAAAGLVVLGMLAIGVVGAVAGTAAAHGDETSTGNETADNETATPTGVMENETAETETAANETAQTPALFVKNQTADGTLSVGSVSLPEGGFVVVFNATLSEPMAHSQYLSPGVHENVSVSLNQSISQNETVIVAAFHDTNGNQQYDRGVDEIYLFFDDPVMDAAHVGPTQAGNVTAPAENVTETPTAENVTETSTGNDTVAQNQTAENESGDEFEEESGPNDNESQNQTAENETAAQDQTADNETTGDECGPKDHETAANETVEQDVTTTEENVTETATADNETVMNETAANETAANETAENGTAETAAIFVKDQPADDTLSVGNVALPKGGFVVVFNATMAEPMAHSQFLEAGEHQNVSVSLNQSVSQNETVIVAAFHDTNGNQQYDLGTDEIYLFFDEPVLDAAHVGPTQAGNVTAPAENVTETPTGNDTVAQNQTAENETAAQDQTADNESGDEFEEESGPNDNESQNQTAENKTETPTADNETAANATVQNAALFVKDQPADDTLSVGNVALPEGGFVVVFNATMAEPMAHSQFLEAGEHQNVSVSLNQSISQNETLVVAAFHDTNGNQQFDWGVDEIYLFFDDPVMDAATVGAPQAGNATATPTATGNETAE